MYNQARKAQAKELGMGGEDEEEEEDEGVRRVDGTSQASTAKPGDSNVAGATISAEAMAAMAAAASASLPQIPGNPAAQAHIVAAQAVAARLVAGAASVGTSLASSSMPPPPVPTINTAMLQAMQSIPGVTLAPGVVS